MAFFQYPSLGNQLQTSLVPSVTNTYDIGSSSLFWREIFIRGRLNIGQARAYTAHNLEVTTTPLTTGAAQYQTFIDSICDSTATTENVGLFAKIRSIAASFTTARADVIQIGSPTIGGGNTITRLNGIRFSADVTGGTNNAFITDNLTYTGSPLLHFTTNKPSFFTGAVAHARLDVASAATITALASTNGFVRLTGSTITALQGIAAGIDGQVLRLFNNAGVAVTIQHENAGATAANRITTMTGADIATTANGFAEFIYDTGTSRWICMYVST